MHVSEGERGVESEGGRCQREREVSEGESEWGDTHVLVHVCVQCALCAYFSACVNV